MATTFEDILQKDGQLAYTNRGFSMMPLLRQNRDIIIITRKSDKRLSLLDCPLFKRSNGQYVLHRVMWVHRSGYTLCGDNQWYLERGVTEDQILGVLTAVVRDGRRIEMDSFGMRCYSVAQWVCYPVRACFLFIRMTLWPRIKNKFFK